MRQGKKSQKWYFSNTSLIVALLCVGPFALPLLWSNPRFSLKMKLLVSGLVICLTVLSVVLLSALVRSFLDTYQSIFPGGVTL